MYKLEYFRIILFYSVLFSVSENNQKVYFFVFKGVFRHSRIIQNYFKLFLFRVGRNWDILELFCFILLYSACLKTTLSRF